MSDNTVPVRSNDFVSERLAEIDRISDPSTKVKALVELASQLLPSPSEILAEALKAARSCYDSSTLAAIAPHLPGSERFKVLEQALNIVQRITWAQSIRADALIKVVPHLPASEPQLLQQALGIAQAIEDESTRAHTLVAIAPHLLESEQFKVLEQVLSAAQAIQNESTRARTLIAIAPHLPESEQFKVLEQALSVAQAIEDESTRARTLVAIAPHLPTSKPQLLQRAWSAAQSLNQAVDRGMALAAIAPHLPESEQFKVLEQALSTVQAIQSESMRADALVAIAPHLPTSEPQLLQKAWSAAQAIQNESTRARALVAIAPHLPENEPQLLQQVLSTAQALNQAVDRGKVLAAIAPHLPESKRFKVLEQTLSTAQAIEDAFARTDALVAIASHLSESEPQLLQQALSTAQAIKDESVRADAVVAIVPRLPKSEQFKLLEQALSTAQVIKDESARAYALAAIAPHLPKNEPQLLQQALIKAQAIQNKHDRAYALVEIAPYLPESERFYILKQALRAAQTIKPRSTKLKYRAKALATVAPHIPEIELQLLQQALSTAQAIGDEFDRADTLAAIAPHLPESEPQLLQQALSAAQALQYESNRTSVLVAIAPQLPPDYLPQLLKAIPAAAKEAAGKALTSPAIRFTEALAVQLPSDKHLVALETVKALPQDADKTKFFSALVPCLSLGLIPNALRLIQDGFTQDAYRAEALSNLLPYLPNEQLPEALKCITQSIHTPRHQTTALENLIPFLSLQGLQDVLRFLQDDNAVQSGENLTTESQPNKAQPKVITEPTLRARILSAVATALTGALPKENRLNEPLSPSADATVIAPELQEKVEISLLIDEISNLTIHLQSQQKSHFSYEKEAAKILSQVAPAFAHLSNPDRSDIPKFIVELRDPGYQAQILSTGASYFPEAANQFLEECRGDDYRALLNIKVRVALLDQRHNQTRNEGSISERNKILEEVSEQLDPILKTIEGSYRKAEALVEIALYPVGVRYQSEALGIIRGLSNSYLKTQYFQNLIPNLLDIQRLEAADIIREIQDPYYRVKALVTLACKFPEFRTEAKTAAQALENRIQQIEQLSVLAAEVPEILPEILDIAETAEDPIERPQILVALAPHLPMRINREVNRERSAGRPITDDLWDRALYLLARGYRDALQGGTLRNESTQDKDFLNLQDEVNALSDLLLMRDLEPPMAVGILGGWGGGKSYIMHLMQTRMTEVRSRPITATEAWNNDPTHETLSPYVGHIYQIKFDAWTFAKSDLWASLMQTIFFELNRQITLEQKLLKFFNDNGIDPYAKDSSYGNVWKVLYQIRDEERDYFLERVLQKPDLENLDSAQQDKIDELLWKKRNIVKQAATEELQKQKTALETVNDSLKQKQEDLEKVKAQLEKSQQPDVQELAGQVNQILIISSVLLRKRMGNDAFEDIKKQIEARLPDDLSSKSLQKFGGDLRLLISNILEGTDAEGKPFNFSIKVLKQWGRKNLAFLVIFCGFAAASVLAPFLVAWKLPGAIVPQIVAFIAPLLPAIGMAQKLWRAGQRWYEQTKQVLLDCEIQIKESQAVIERETQRFQKHQEKHIATLEADIAQLIQEAQEIEKQVEVARQAVPENVYASLNEFVADRIEKGDYNKRLGLMHLVKEDLTNLSYRLLPPQLGSQEYAHKLDDLKAVFPRGPARVVVYIDDLDRCPPNRVVQVLEAVQLLVKTPLFIAVLAIDERYITRALEKFYKDVLVRGGRPSGTDYLEKIIQLPYRVRPIMPEALESYLRSQVVIQDSATGGAKFSEFSRKEFNMLLACCKQIDLSPRTLKRLTNVYKLFKIVCRTRGTKPSLQVQQSILALLALSGRYPNLMRGIFDSIETCFEEQRTPEKAEKTSQALNLRSPLRDFFEQYQLLDGDRYLQREFDKLRHDALQTEILPHNLTLDDMTHEIFNLIRSFSFVGEIGEDPEDYRKVDNQSAGTSAPPSLENNEL